jgi:hypothetical protein
VHYVDKTLNLRRISFWIIFFSKQMWHLVYSEIMHIIVWPSTCKAMIGKWSKVYKGSFSNKLAFHRIWKASIKFVCWQLWLARNKAIFLNKFLLPHFYSCSCDGSIGGIPHIMKNKSLEN